MNCLICGSPATIVKDLPKSELLRQYEAYFQVEAPSGAFDIDYALLRCSGCKLEFAYPAIPGNSDFYRWITQQTGYYTENRWEYARVVEQIRNVNSTDEIQVLDVGCGDGRFLKRVVDFIPNVRVYGIDTTPGAIQECVKHGISAFCGSVQDFVTTQIGNWPRRVDIVTAFHLLEHVPDPKGLVNQLVECLTDGGAIYVSTPYSPMFFESRWFDPLNHPPHHISRWNRSSFVELAHQLDLEVTFETEPAASLRTRTLLSASFQLRGRTTSITKQQLLQMALRYPHSILLELSRQLFRERFNGQTIGNVILCRFQKSHIRS